MTQNINIFKQEFYSGTNIQIIIIFVVAKKGGIFFPFNVEGLRHNL